MKIMKMPDVRVNQPIIGYLFMRPIIKIPGFNSQIPGSSTLFSIATMEWVESIGVWVHEFTEDTLRSMFSFRDEDHYLSYSIRFGKTQFRSTISHILTSLSVGYSAIITEGEVCIDLDADDFEEFVRTGDYLVR